jgi:hypothetical protein
MNKKSSIYTAAWLAGLVLALLIFGQSKTQAQDVNTLFSLNGWVDRMPSPASTYAGDRFDAAVFLNISKSEKICQPHLALPAHRNPGPPRQPGKAHLGKGNPGIPCAQQPIVKLRRRMGRGRRI